MVGNELWFCLVSYLLLWEQVVSYVAWDLVLSLLSMVRLLMVSYEEPELVVAVFVVRHLVYGKHLKRSFFFVREYAFMKSKRVDNRKSYEQPLWLMEMGQALTLCYNFCIYYCYF